MSTQRHAAARMKRLQGEIAEAAEEARALLARRIAEIDPDLIAELTVGIRSRERDDASWTDSWADRFNDNGKFDDQWINLSGLRDTIVEREGPAAP
jgi:hypothetical protein